MTMTANGDEAPRYLEQFLPRSGGAQIATRTAGSLGGQAIRSLQQPGDWSDPKSSDLAVSVCLSDDVPVSLTIGDRRCRVRMTRPRIVAIVSPGVDTSFVQDGVFEALLVAIPMQQLVALDDDGLNVGSGDFEALHSGEVDDVELIRLVEAYWHAAGLSTPGAGLAADGALLQLLGRLVHLRDRSAVPMRGGLAGWQKRRCVEMMNQPGGTEVSLAELAANVRLSPFHFCRAFKESFGVPPHRYQVLARLDRAKAMLAHGQEGFVDVALACGYGSSQSLARIFRRETGLSPAQYRREARW